MFVLPTWGNHDYQVDEARQQREIFALPENGFDERWWRLDAGPVTVLGLDSNWFRKPVAEWPRQNDWMRAQIEASAAPWKLALYHHSQARCGDDARGAGQIRKHWMPTMEAHQVHAIAGHAHTYSRIWTDRHPADGHGIWQLTVGRTGQPSDPRPPYVVPTPPPPALPTPCVPDAGFAAASWRNAYLVVDADSTSLKFTLVDADDRTAVDRLALRR